MVKMNSYKIEEFTVKNNNQKIYGQIYIPEKDEEKYPLVILSHGLGGNYADGKGYAENLVEKGIVVVTFDFRGGGGQKSEGKITDMSVLTEISDLETVLNEAINWDFIDSSRVVLLGASQGGLVSAVVASNNPEKVSGLILTYPAFNIETVVNGLMENFDNIPDTYDLGYITLGKAYATDLKDFNTFDKIKNYDKKVLLLHGSADEAVPLKFSIDASKIYNDVDFQIIFNAGHGFYDYEFRKALKYIFDYLNKINFI